jgi:signal transduction histidine kinase
VDRLLYGRHPDRTEVLSRLAATASTTAAGAEDLLAEVARLLVQGTGASRAEVWLAVEPLPRLAASAGAAASAGPAMRADVRHHGELLGQLRLYAQAAADLVPDAGPVLDDVAHSLGVVLRNTRLTTQLRAQLEELRDSRHRLVEAHDQARRRLERDIHDGAQVRLISLRLRLGLLRTLVDAEDHDGVRAHLDTLAQEVDAAVRSLRELARGLHPPILEQSGLAAALRAHVRGLPATVSVAAPGVGRYPRAVEGAVYFACLEAIQNAIRHGQARQIDVEVTADGATLRFRVCDDGAGFDPGQVVTGTGLANINDRVSALGGRNVVESATGQGTRIVGEIPAQPLVEER